MSRPLSLQLQESLHTTLKSLTTPFARATTLNKLPEHADVVLLSALGFLVVHVVLSPLVCGVIGVPFVPRVKAQYLKRSKKGRGNWDAHVVALVHALIIVPLSFNALNLDALVEDKAFGWDPQVGNVIGVACGYFLWDALESLIQFQDIGFVVHGVSCLIIYLLSFKPFIAYYGPRFLLWELSTPFLNVHWFLDKLELTGSVWQLVNGVLLLSTFAGARLVYGTYQSYHFYKTMYELLDRAPTGVILAYCIGNVILNVLNWIWFTKMIAALKKRLRGQKKGSNGGLKSKTQ